MIVPLFPSPKTDIALAAECALTDRAYGELVTSHMLVGRPHGAIKSVTQARITNFGIVTSAASMSVDDSSEYRDGRLT